MRFMTLAGFGLGLLLSACSVYGPPEAAPPRASGRPVSSAPAAVTTTVAFGATDATAVRAYYSGAKRGRGQNARGGLPPGIAKNVARGKPLPPGIARQHVPADLLVRLPAAPSGLEYLIVAGKLILVETATQIVRQVLLDAVF